ncbi:MAG: vitamin K epoxide reductase family protein [Chloroflexota bacterium]|nr:MAG: vitamin K epoxide reductase family protein [Chloroflexota bacterium]
MDSKLRISSIILAILGLVDSIYLTWVKYTGAYALCGPIGDCESVNSSQYSEVFGIPIALLGAGAYALIILLLVLERYGGVWIEYGQTIVFGMSLIGVLYSIYLTYIEIAVLKAICPYCVISAIILLALLVISGFRLAISLRE